MLLEHTCGHEDPHLATAFALKPVYMAVQGKAYRLLCNQGQDGMKACTSECMQQFRALPMAVEECKTAVKNSFGGGIGSGAGGGCFPGNSTVCVRRRGKISMDDLNIGDEVLTPSGFEPVLAFLHREAGTFQFLCVKHERGELTAHADHLLRIFSQTNSVFASSCSVRVGDRLSVLWLDGQQVPSRVLEISTVNLKGLFCPLTFSGEIFVDGACCSCYSPPASLVSCDISHDACHAALAPLRMLRKFLPDPSQHLKHSAIHPYCASILSLFNWFC